tara:strand:+ start:374 stop:1108 length:735 start_codon:yes stop_codon:yes gene_type:complete
MIPSCKIYAEDNIKMLWHFDDASFRLAYIDPPFNTGRKQKRNELSFSDSYANYEEFLYPRLDQAYRILTDDGSLFVHLDYREVHYVKIMLDKLFGRACFMNEIIWAYDYGARSKKRWSTKHDSILWYVKDPDNYCFNYEAMDRIPYMAPGLVGKEKAARGKTPTDVWWHTIVSPNSKEKTGYPTQKPLGILRRIVNVHSNEGDELIDFFAGSGSFGKAAIELKRNVTLIDQNPDALDVMRKRLL